MDFYIFYSSKQYHSKVHKMKFAKVTKTETFNGKSKVPNKIYVDETRKCLHQLNIAVHKLILIFKSVNDIQIW
jgi:hypothetical protein